MMCVVRVDRCCRSLQQLFIVVVVLASFSTLLTYQIGSYLTWTDPRDSSVRDPRPPGRDPRPPGAVNVPHPKEKHVEVHHNHRHLSQASKSAQILAKLLQIEDQLMAISHRRRVLLIGSNHSALPGADVLQRAFTDNDLKMTVNIDQTQSDGSASKHPWVPSDFGRDQYAWSMIWCLSGTHNCSSHLQHHIYQLINWIPTLASHLMSPSKLCDMQTTLQGVLDETTPYTSCTVVSKSSSLPPPPRYPSHALQYALKPPASDLHDVIITKSLHKKSLNLKKDTVIWTCPRGLLSLGNRTLTLRLSVLVSSLSPLRVYLHPSGALGPGGGQQSNQEYNTILVVRRAISEEYGLRAANRWWLNVQRKLVALLLNTEYAMSAGKDTHACGCVRCSQLLSVDMVFTTDLQTIVLQVTEALPSNKEVLEDTVAMMSSTDRVAVDVATVLDDVGQDVFLANQDCPGSLGLTDRDLVYLLDNHRELRAPTQFHKIYPHLKSSHFAGLINKLRQTSIQSRSRPLHSGVELSTNDRWPSCHVTSDLHSLLSSMEKRYLGESGDQALVMEDKVPQKAVIPIQAPLQPSRERTPTDSETKKTECSNDLRDAPYLSSIQTHPEISLHPTFDPGHMTYQAEVDYDVFLLRISAAAKSCRYEARVDIGYSIAGGTNVTLGVGDNTLHIMVVDPAHPQAWVISTYIINVKRHTADVYLPQYSLSLKLVTCTLKQDCSLQYDPSEPCGVQSVTGKGHMWADFTDMSQYFPPCQHWDRPVWYVPCESCSRTNSCHWKQARWQTSGCAYRFLTPVEVQKCLSGKKLMFIGDSTNRGILHYILERVNGSLTQWDKTHSLKIYSNVNNNSTMLSFTYYPQFWLPVNHRPAFDKAVYQLIRSTLPLENSTNTVLVVGGVHWLGTQHLSLILQAIHRERLTGIRLIMKGLGAGFHQRIPGIRFAPMDEQRRLMAQEAECADFAVQHGFGVVPTYNMTMARYRDFLQGKCACHFHKVTKKYRIPPDDVPAYHVEGDINSLYSELVINQICQH